MDQQDLPSLKELREKAGLALEEIQEQTLFPLSKLEALEEKRYEDIGTDTFIIGYIQRYARVVGADAVLYIEEYKRENSVEDPSHTGSHPVSDSERTENSAKTVGGSILSKLNLFHYVAIIIGLWIVITLIFGGDNKGEVDQKVESDASIITTPNEESPVENDEPLVTVENTIEEAGLQQSEDVSIRDAVENPDSVEVEPVEVESVEVESVEVGPRQTETEVENTQPLAEAAEEVDVSASTQETSPVDQSAVSLAQEDVLIFSFSDDCWVKVQDAQGKVLFADSRNKGDNLQILGQGPFEVMLGNARAVELLLVNGESFPVKPKPNNRTLRFSVTP